MQSIINTCTSRKDIIQGSFNPEIFTASTSHVASAHSNKGSAINSIYIHTEAFFREAIFPVENFHRVARNVMGQLNGDNHKSAIHRLKIAFGGGKSHALIALTYRGCNGTQLADTARYDDYRKAIVTDYSSYPKFKCNGNRTIPKIRSMRSVHND